MRDFLKNFKRLFYTLKDIGIYRIYLRILYEKKIFLGKIFSKKINILLLNPSNSYPLWDKDLDYLFNKIVRPPISKKEKKYINFEFINIRRNLKLPLEWENKDWSRLWQFNLHYFDWAKNWLDNAIKTGRWEENAFYLETLIDEWINFNEIGYGDGWNSYTISLRSRNWIWLFRFCPILASKNRIESLWNQVLWLESHLEKCHGGNHYLENLITLIFSSLQFKGHKPSEIFIFSIRELERELKNQILEDGGHQERSASYHILILDRLVELAFSLKIFKGYVPQWLLHYIDVMNKWQKKVTLFNYKYPRFNDSAKGICPNPKSVEIFADCLLNKKKITEKGFRESLSKILPSDNQIKQDKSTKTKEIIHLNHTGWIIVKTQNNWELIFKCGLACPKHLPAHAHSDLLSFDLFCNGKPIIAESGTSTYTNNVVRSYERSSKAHNVFQIGKKNNLMKRDNIKWIEPIDTWDSFRAGKKAKISIRKKKILSDGTIILEAGHNGFASLGVSYFRKFKIIEMSDKNLQLEIHEEINCKKSVSWRQWWHLGPEIPKSVLFELMKKYKEENNVKYTWHETHYSEDFNLRTKRNSLCLSGFLPRGKHKLISKLIFDKI